MNEELENQNNDRRRDSKNLSDDEIIQIAKSKTSLIGVVMIVTGFFMLMASFTSIVMVYAPQQDINISTLEWIKTWSQDPQFQADIQKQIDLRKNLDPKVKTAEKVTNTVTSLIGFVGDLLVIYAGFCIKSLKSYGMCIAGTAASFFINGCCCFCIPVGIWAVIVLVNPTVKEGFAIMKRRTSLAQ